LISLPNEKIPTTVIGSWDFFIYAAIVPPNSLNLARNCAIVLVGWPYLLPGSEAQILLVANTACSM